MLFMGDGCSKFRTHATNEIKIFLLPYKFKLHKYLEANTFSFSAYGFTYDITYDSTYDFDTFKSPAEVINRLIPN